eukprot:scaffold26316_cov60-Phaeocystis_antarctica.AAC.8
MKAEQAGHPTAGHPTLRTLRTLRNLRTLRTFRVLRILCPSAPSAPTTQPPLASSAGTGCSQGAGVARLTTRSFASQGQLVGLSALLARLTRERRHTQRGGRGDLLGVGKGGEWCTLLQCRSAVQHHVQQHAAKQPTLRRTGSSERVCKRGRDVLGA